MNPSFFIVDREMLYPRLELFYLWLLNRMIRVLANIIHNDGMNNLRSNRTNMYLLKYVTCVLVGITRRWIQTSRGYAVASPHRRVVLARQCVWKIRGSYMFACKCWQINIAKNIIVYSYKMFFLCNTSSLCTTFPFSCNIINIFCLEKYLFWILKTRSVFCLKAMVQHLLEGSLD